MTWIKDAAWKLYGAYKRHFLDRIAREMSYTDETLHKALEVYKDYEPPRLYESVWKVGDILKFRLVQGFGDMPESFFLVIAIDKSEMEGFSRVRLICPDTEIFDGLIYNWSYVLVQSLDFTTNDKDQSST